MGGHRTGGGEGGKAPVVVIAGPDGLTGGFLVTADLNVVDVLPCRGGEKCNVIDDNAFTFTTSTAYDSSSLMETNSFSNGQKNPIPDDKNIPIIKMAHSSQTIIGPRRPLLGPGGHSATGGRPRAPGPRGRTAVRPLPQVADQRVDLRHLAAVVLHQGLVQGPRVLLQVLAGHVWGRGGGGAWGVGKKRHRTAQGDPEMGRTRGMGTGQAADRQLWGCNPQSAPPPSKIIQ